MADLTQSAQIRLFPGAGIRSEHKTVDTSVAQNIFKGQPLIIDQSVDSLNLTPFVDATVVVVADVFMGIAAQALQSVVGADETKNEIEFYVWPTIIGLPSAVFTEADLGKPVQMSDSKTLSVTTLANPTIGKLHAVQDGYAYVQLITPALCASSGA